MLTFRLEWRRHPVVEALRNPRVKDAGVTLIEMLVVLVLIGVGAGIVTYALPSGSAARSVSQEATLLKSRLNIAAERSLIGGRPFRMTWTSTGYRFEEWEGAKWQTASSPPFIAAHVFDDAVSLTTMVGGSEGEIAITPDLLPTANGVVEIRLKAGTSSETLVFDGAAARIEGGTL